MNELREAIFHALSTDAPLAGLVGTRIFHQRAPLSTAAPYVVFSRQAGTPSWTFKGPPVQSDLWLVKAVDESGSASTAEDVAAAIDVALTDAALPMDDRTTLYARRASDVSYCAVNGVDTYFHEGAMYRIFTASDAP